MSAPSDTQQVLVDFARELSGKHELVILGEGNVSALPDGASGGDGARFFVKASGARLSTLTPEQLVEIKAAPLLAALEDDRERDDDEIEQLLMDARVDADALKPSVETFFHAWFLGRLPEVQVVGHVHAPCVNQVLCSPGAEPFARHPLFPDQIVCCGPEMLLVPYVDPGIELSRAIADEMQAFREKNDYAPKTVLLKNHGIIAVGAARGDVTAALTMAEKAARVFVGASSVGGPDFMDEQAVRRIAARQDEHYRRKMIRHN